MEQSFDQFLDSEDILSWLLANADDLSINNNKKNDFDLTVYDNLYPINDSIPIQSENNHSNILSNDLYNNIPNISNEPITSNQSINKTISSSLLKSNDDESGNYDNDDDSDSNEDVSSKKRYTNRKPSNNKRRKKDNIEELERKVQQLQEENSELQAHLLNISQRNSEVQKQREVMEAIMAQKIQNIDDNPNSYNEIQDLVKKYTDIYADYGRCRQKEINFHLNQLEKLIVPTQTTKMILWSMQQDKSFINTPLFKIFVSDLGITKDQLQHIQKRKQLMKELQDLIKESLNLIQVLRTTITNKHNQLDTRMRAVQNIATPTQNIQFLLWINKNSDKLAKLIPNFNSPTMHIPSADFVEEI